MTEDIFRRISGDRPSIKLRPSQTFKLDSTVRIISGPFASFTGKVVGINQAKSLLKVEVAICGNKQSVKINFMDAENL